MVCWWMLAAVPARVVSMIVDWATTFTVSWTAASFNVNEMVRASPRPTMMLSISSVLKPLIETVIL